MYEIIFYYAVMSIDSTRCILKEIKRNGKSIRKVVIPEDQFLMYFADSLNLPRIMSLHLTEFTIVPSFYPVYFSFTNIITE